MPIRIGGSNITDIKVGSTAINEVYKGSSRVWHRGVDVQYVYSTINSGSTIIQWYGYSYLTSGSSITDGTCNFKGGSNYYAIVFVDSINGGNLSVAILGNHGNSGFSKVTINGNVYRRSDSNFVFQTFNDGTVGWITYFTWADTTNPFPTNNTTYVVVFE